MTTDHTHHESKKKNSCATTSSHHVHTRRLVSGVGRAIMPQHYQSLDV